MDETDAQVNIAVKANPGTNTAELMTEKMARVKGLYIEIEALCGERHLALENVLEACDKFWDGVEQLRISLGSVKRHLDTHDPPAAELHHIEEQIHEHEVGTDLDVKLNGRCIVCDVSDCRESGNRYPVCVLDQRCKENYKILLRCILPLLFKIC